MSNIHHNRPELSAILSQATEAGLKVNEAGNQLPALAETVMTATVDGHISIGLTRKAIAGGECDIPEIFSAYEKARVTGQGNDKGAIAAHKQQVSKLRAFGKIGAYMGNDGVDLFNTAREAFKEAKANASKASVMKKQGEYEYLASVMTRQLKDIPEDTVPNTYDTPISQEEIERLLYPSDKAEKTDADRVKELMDKARKLYEGTEEKPGIDSEDLKEAGDWLEKAYLKLNPAAAAEKAKAEADAEVREQILAQYGEGVLSAFGVK